MTRLFRPGDRGQQRHGGLIMEVVKYISEKIPLDGKEMSDHDLKCVWFEDGARKTDTLDQRTLFKVEHGGGLFED